MRLTKTLSTFFLVIGLGLLLVSGYLSSNTRQFTAKARTAQGIVTDLARQSSPDQYRNNNGGVRYNGFTYAPVVGFTTDRGEKTTFTSSQSNNPPAFHKGQSVEVLYDPLNPLDARINNFSARWLGFLITAGLGAIFTCIGMGMLLYGPLRQRRTADLIANGRVITADFQGAAPNLGVSVNGRSPWQILAQWQDPETSEVHVFRSDNVWFNPEAYIDRKTLTVYAAKDNLKKYHVDISFLPKPAQ